MSEQASDNDDLPATTNAPQRTDADEATGTAVESGRFGVWLATGAALLALAVSLFVGWQQLELADRSSDSGESFDAALAGVHARLDALDGHLAKLGETQDGLSAGIAGRAQQLARLNERLGGLDAALATLGRERGSPRRELLVAEAEQLLRLAARTLQLARDPVSATAALRSADERLRELGDPGLGAVRQSIARDLETLQALQIPDIEGYVLTLGSLAQSVPRLPLRGPENGSTGDDANIQPAEDQSGIERAWSVVGGAFSKLITVRRVEAPVTPLLAPQEEGFLRRNLQLELASARLALLEREPAAYRETLRSARSWLATYFDPGDREVASTLRTLERLEAEPIDATLPDISGSLALLEQLSQSAGAGT